MNIELLRELHAEAESSSAALAESDVAWDRSAAASPRFQIVRQYLDAVGRALNGATALDQLDFVDKACDLRGLYWDSPKTACERRALDSAAALFLRLRDELAKSA